MGYSPWGHKELDMTEHTHTSFNPSVFSMVGFSRSAEILLILKVDRNSKLDHISPQSYFKTDITQ